MSDVVNVIAKTKSTDVSNSNMGVNIALNIRMRIVNNIVSEYASTAKRSRI